MLGHARGVAVLAAVEAGLPVVEYTPAEIKRAVVGYGRAEKPQVQQMVKLLLGLDTAPSPHDAADALAVAHLSRARAARGLARPPTPRARRSHLRSWRHAKVPAARAGVRRRDCASVRHAAREARAAARSSTSAASATTCWCRCRRSTPSASPARRVALRIHTHVREDALQLFGFATPLEQALFERLISVSGIGPKLALAVLSGIEPADLVRAIRSGRTSRG